MTEEIQGNSKFQAAEKVMVYNEIQNLQSKTDSINDKIARMETSIAVHMERLTGMAEKLGNMASSMEKMTNSMQKNQLEITTLNWKIILVAVVSGASGGGIISFLLRGVV